MNDNCTNIQAETSVTGIHAEKPRLPGEQPGRPRSRRHRFRDALLLGLALPSMILGGTCAFWQGMFVWEALHSPPAVSGPLPTAFSSREYLDLCRATLVMATVAMPLSLAAWGLARRELARIRKELVYRTGWTAVVEARRWALIGLVCSGVTGVISGVVVLVRG
jgi:hypothetical protein